MTAGSNERRMLLEPCHAGPDPASQIIARKAGKQRHCCLRQSGDWHQTMAKSGDFAEAGASANKPPS